MPTPFIGRAGKSGGRRRAGGPSPPEPTEGVFSGGTGEFFEDFKSGYVMGSANPADRTASHLWGDRSKAEHPRAASAPCSRTALRRTTASA